MLFFPIKLDGNRYKRTESETRLILMLTKDFLISNELQNGKIEDIKDFIDQALDETPIEDFDMNLIKECK
ncbi:hypothetical protein BKH42_08730 [Helicobacter sp. 13S00482-2]|uniref:hypothetical protein n=1 Tax=Helicobacter sp. 13S00482-2 TaxID=1476200 RepID=UPI000BA642A6|nr:hypothetical protein [Helicobacter sp. 13S00482-2]PAF52920.1 hypothetical protein BKH42_08730 [Helicobacter sp. 13S00482-2]